MSEADVQKLESILADFNQRQANLIPILQRIQGQFHYLPEEMLRRVARKLNMRMPEVYQVATFYRCFSLKPRGKHLVQVCLGTACHVRGGERVLDRVHIETGAGPTGTSQDMEFTVEPVRCIGCCGLAPVIRVDGKTIAHMEQAKVRGVINRYRPKTSARAEQPQEVAHD